MESARILSDFDHPAVKACADQLTSNKDSPVEKVESIFHFVRDGIRFGFPPRWDTIRASEVLRLGIGYCTPKATLFRALCKAAGIPARVHSGLIRTKIMRGIFPSFAFPFLPDAGPHSWVDVKIEETWRPIDSYITDLKFYEGALEKLVASKESTGYSIALIEGDSSCDFNFGEKGFVQMGAVVEDHGGWNDYSEYMNTYKYVRLNRLQRLTFPLIAVLSNRNIGKLRRG
jgi:hypothetical protein